MSTAALLTMIIVLGIVWGGLVFFITRALKYEKEKKNIGAE